MSEIPLLNLYALYLVLFIYNTKKIMIGEIITYPN